MKGGINMDEQNNEETEPQEKPEDAVGDNDKGNKPKTPKVIEDANSAAERMEAANEKREELIGREEELAANRHLAGESEAGQPSEKKEETDKEYKDRIMAA